jgi:hypothetical protein
MILATHHDSTKADIERAIDMAEQLTEKLDGSFDAPRAFDLLAVTRAAKGQFELALDASNTAIAKAQSNRQLHLADEFENHRKLIASGRRIPFETP